MDFRNTVIILTSNLGSQHAKANGSMRFGREGDEGFRKTKEAMLAELRRTFRPELLNRIDEIIVFEPLTEAQIEQIVDLMLARVQQQLDERHLKLAPTEAARKLLAEEGFDPEYGARPLRRTIQRLVENPVARGILQGEYRGRHRGTRCGRRQNRNPPTSKLKSGGYCSNACFMLVCPKESSRSPGCVHSWLIL